MKVSNMIGARGREVANQFIMSEEGRGANGNFIRREIFQSYKSVIAERTIWPDRIDIKLDSSFWNYSTTTSKYRNMFLGEDTKTTEKKIASGEYQLVNLN